jgi:hypothetical protein
VEVAILVNVVNWMSVLDSIFVGHEGRACIDGGNRRCDELDMMRYDCSKLRRMRTKTGREREGRRVGNGPLTASVTCLMTIGSSLVKSRYR